MAAYNFKPQFVDAILRAEKMHTIRAPRKRRTKVGETVHLFTGQRTKKCKLLMRAICTKVENIEIDGGWETVSGEFFGHVIIDNNRIDGDELEALARSDGFSSFDEMMEFWRGRLPFTGEIIHWNTPEALEFQRLVPSASNVRFVDPRRGAA